MFDWCREKLRTWKGKDRERQKQLAKHLKFLIEINDTFEVKIEVKYEVSLNVSACDYSELKSILIHAHHKGIFICLGFLTL